MSDAFDRLSPAMRFQIVNNLGFQSLRPVQELATHVILEDKNCVVLAPTAGGKTEAAFFPLLSRIDAEDWRPTSVLYVAPIRALLNNQYDRLARYAQLIGRRVFTWHGDTPPTQRRAFANDPTDILLTTPESLEVMLMSARVPARRIFAGLRAVVIDEVHAFVSDDRGGHLSAILERLSRFCGRDVQRIGLSATVGNPEEILAWAAGSSKRSGEVVRAPGEKRTPDLALDFVGSEENAAKVIAALHPGKKRLVFVDSRRGVEAVGRALSSMGVTTFVTHSSLSVAERRLAEQAFSEGRDCVIVSTSALELGIDIGDLDHVIQIDAPNSVAAFLQRMGRSGRRDDTRPNCTFLTTEDETLVKAAALLRLHQSGYVEPVRLRRRAVHLLAHQIMALSIQEEGIPVSDWWSWISAATPFQDLTESDRAELLEHMIGAEILLRDGGRLSLGAKGQKMYGFRNFAELYSVFSSPAQLTVVWGSQEIGFVESSFLQSIGAGPVTFTLGARTWFAKHIDWDQSVVYVEPVATAKHARWQGRPRFLQRRLCDSIRDVLSTTSDDAWWSKRARQRMREIRPAYDFLGLSPTPLVEDREGIRWWNFAGGAANVLLAKLFEARLGGRVVASDQSLSFREEASTSFERVRKAITQMAAAGGPREEDAVQMATTCVKGRMSKFQPCLTERLEALYLADALIDWRSAQEAVSTAPTVDVQE